MVSLKSSVIAFVRGKIHKHDGSMSFWIALISLLPLLIRGPLDQEEYDLGIFSGQFAFESLWEGSFGLWLPELGFGTPMPIGQSFGSYFPFASLSIFGMSLWFCVFWLAQLWLGTYFMLRLCRRLGVEHRVAIVAAVSFVLSMPTMNYGMTDEWPTAFFTWTMYPVVISLLTDLLLSGDSDRLANKIPLLGFVLGLWLSKSHPGHISLLLIPMAIYVLVLMPWRNMRIFFALSVAGVISLLISLDTYAFIYAEAAHFPSGLSRATQPGYTPLTYLWTLLYPLTSPPDQMFISGMSNYLRNRFSRGPFFGTPFMLLAIGASLWLTIDRNRIKAATGLAFLTALILSMADTSVSKVFSGLWLARDPVVLFGILTAAMLLTSIRQTESVWQKRVGTFLLAGQAGHVLLAFIPFIAYNGFHFGAPETFAARIHYVGEGKPSNLKNWLTGNGSRTGQRFFLSNQVQGEMRRAWIDEGIYGYTVLVRLGLHVVTGWFKNVSMDSIYPSPYLMHGKISGDSFVIDNRSFLDVAGIRWILVGGNEVQARPKNSGFQPPLVFNGRNGKSLALLENLDAWPLAVFIDPRLATITDLPRASNCPLEGIACADFEQIKDARQADKVETHTVHEQIILNFLPSSRPRQIFMTVFAHDGWIARADGKELPINKVGGVFMSMSVPAGIGKIELTYGSTWRMATMIISITSGVLMAFLAILLAQKGCSLNTARLTSPDDDRFHPFQSQGHAPRNL